MSSPEFDAALAATVAEHEKADGIASLVAASRQAAVFQHRAEVAEAALVERGAEIEQLHKAPHGKAKCHCDMGPGSDGPEQDCPKHGDVSWYAAWLEQASDEYNKAAHAINRLLALCDEFESDDMGSIRLSEIRAALEATP